MGQIWALLICPVFICICGTLWAIFGPEGFAIFYCRGNTETPLWGGTCTVFHCILLPSPPTRMHLTFNWAPLCFLCFRSDWNLLNGLFWDFQNFQHCLLGALCNRSELPVGETGDSDWNIVCHLEKYRNTFEQFEQILVNVRWATLMQLQQMQILIKAIWNVIQLALKRSRGENLTWKANN